MRKWFHNSLLENPKPLIFKQKNLQMGSQQPPGESKAISHGFAAASWRIQNHQYFNKKNVQMGSQQPPGESKTINISKTKIANGFTTASWRIKTINISTTNVQMDSQQHPGESKTVNI